MAEPQHCFALLHSLVVLWVWTKLLTCPVLEGGGIVGHKDQLNWVYSVWCSWLCSWRCGVPVSLISIGINGLANADSKVVSHEDQVNRDWHQLYDLFFLTPFHEVLFDHSKVFPNYPWLVGIETANLRSFKVLSVSCKGGIASFSSVGLPLRGSQHSPLV